MDSHPVESLQLLFGHAQAFDLQHEPLVTVPAHFGRGVVELHQDVKQVQDESAEVVDVIDMRHRMLAPEFWRSVDDSPGAALGRQDGKQVDVEEFMKLTNIFKNNITLDRLPRAQLVAMCRFMQLRTFGSDSYLRFQLQSKLSQLQRDDQSILWEGLDSLSMSELKHACVHVGIGCLPACFLQPPG